MLEKTIILDGFSKTYSMTGWRLGYGVMPLWLADAVDRLMVNSNSCTASFTQRAGHGRAARAAGRRRRDGGRVPPAPRRHRRGPERAFPASAARCPPARSTRSRTSPAPGCRARSSADLLLNEAGVACLSGTAFGEYGDGYLRFSYANSLENIQKRSTRIQKVSDTLDDVVVAVGRSQLTTRQLSARLALGVSLDQRASARRLLGHVPASASPRRSAVTRIVSSMRTCSCCSGRSMIGSIASTMPASNGRLQSPTSCTDSPT